MVDIIQIDTGSKPQVDQFVQFHYDLYKGCPQWVPPFYSDIRLMLNRNKHPYYEHSDADFFLALQNGEVVGRIAAMENKAFNKYHNSKKMQFYLFDTIDDSSVAQALFNRCMEWGHKRGLNEVVGPKGFGSFDGYGIQAMGFEHRQMMTMMNYNYPYYVDLMEGLKFQKVLDFVSCYVPIERFNLPEKVIQIAEKVEEKGNFWVKKFENKAELKKWAWPIGDAYNQTFINNWEYYPLTRSEVKLLLDNLLVVANPKLIKLIMYKDLIIGFLLAFPDVSAALQRQGGKITPWGIIDIMAEMKRTKWVSLNGVGILPEYQGRGGNALLYYEMAKTIRDFGFVHAEQTQMADTAVQVRKDMITMGAEIYKAHRIYSKPI
jgi:hypothetical protein